MKNSSKMDFQNMSFIRENSVSCPKCNQAIIKSDGCNKMVCGTCAVRFLTRIYKLTVFQTYFCYLCGRIVDKANPYSHFNANKSQCFGRLFEGATIDAGLEEYFDLIL